MLSSPCRRPPLPAKTAAGGGGASAGLLLVLLLLLPSLLLSLLLPLFLGGRGRPGPLPPPSMAAGLAACGRGEGVKGVRPWLLGSITFD